MPDDTDLHDLNRPDRGATNWHTALNDNFTDIDARLELRGTKADRPAAADVPSGAKYRVDSGPEKGAVFVESGGSWDKQPVDAPAVQSDDGTFDQSITDPSGTTHAGELADVADVRTDEEVEDIVSALLAAGDKLSWSYDDANDTLTIDTTALDEEEVEDTVGSLVSAGSNITVNYDDANDVLTIGLDTHASTHEKGGADELTTFGDTTHDLVQTDYGSITEFDESSSAGKLFQDDGGTWHAVNQRNGNEWTDSDPAAALQSLTDELHSNGGGKISVRDEITGAGSYILRGDVTVEGYTNHVGWKGSPSDHLIKCIPQDGSREFGGTLKNFRLTHEASSGNYDALHMAADGSGNSCADYHFKGVWFGGAPRNTVRQNASWGAKFIGCLMEGGSQGGWYHDGDQTHALACYVARNTTYGMKAGSSSGRMLLFIECSDNRGKGANITNGRHLGVIIANGNDDTGIVISAAESGPWILKARNNNKANGTAWNMRFQATDVSAFVHSTGGTNISDDIRADWCNRLDLTGHPGSVEVLQADNVKLRGELDSVTVDSSVNDLRLKDAPNSITDNGTRTVIDGWGENSGDPSSTGDWNGNGYEGAAVVDTSNSTKYVYRGGSWV